jgi:hypothetical protein
MPYDRTLIVIRERSFLDLLDLALLVVRDRPVVLGLTAIAGIAPFAAFNVWLMSGDDSRFVLWVLLLIMETPWATAPLTVALGDLMFGVRPRPRKIVKTLVVSFPSLFLTQFLIRGMCYLILIGYVLWPAQFAFHNEVLLLVCYLILIGYVLMPPQFAFLNEVLLLERAGPLRAVKRSRDISRRFEGELFVRWLGQIALGLTFALCFQKGAESFGSVLAGGDVTWERAAQVDAGDLLFQAGVWIAIAFFTVVRFLSYIDRRIRLEGWEIELRLRSVGRALEERPQ